MAVLAARFGDSYRWMVTIPAMIGTIATILSSTIANVALPEIMGAYGMGQDHAQLVATAFLASVTGTMLLNGWLVDRFGFRLTYSAAMLIFIFGSLLSGFAPDEGTLIVGRVMQARQQAWCSPWACKSFSWSIRRKNAALPWGYMRWAWCWPRPLARHSAA
jgi:MFS family permease